MILVSSCLCGEKCKYNGEDNLNLDVMAYLSQKEVIQVCPEVLGGLSTPRIPAEIVGGSARDVLEGNAKVLTKEGHDVTMAFIKGANKVLLLAKQFSVKQAILKAKSPSCGKGKVYDGCFNHNLIAGNGITAEVLLKEGIEVITEVELLEAFKATGADTIIADKQAQLDAWKATK